MPGSTDGGSSECLGQQWPINLCAGGCLNRYPDHCYDGAQADSELGIDCGGDCQACTNGACVQGSDCLSGECVGEVDGMTCHAPLKLTFTAHELSPSVGSTAWSLTLRNTEAPGGATFAIKDLELRYYFDRSGVTEPIVVRGTQSIRELASGDDVDLAGETSWVVERSEDRQDAAYNAYLAVTFGDPGQLAPEEEIRIYQQMLSGEPSTSRFDQRAAYSFTAAQGVEWQQVNVFYQGKLVWGLEPPPNNPRACFVRGVDLNGATTSVAGNVWEIAVEAGVTTNGTGTSQSNPLLPAASGGLATMLATATRLAAGQALQLPTDNGQYLAYLYVTSASNTNQASALTVQGTEYVNSSKFRAQIVDAGYAWSRLGPYRLEVTTASLTVAATSGSVDLAGIELWHPE